MASQKTPKTPDELALAIEILVAAYVDDARRAVQVALDDAFARARPPTARAPLGRQREQHPETTSTAKRRSAAEIAEVKERLYSVVCTRAGESMTVFAEELGLPLRSLELPMSKLRAEGKVRCVGERNMARYFPALGRRSKSES